LLPAFFFDDCCWAIYSVSNDRDTGRCRPISICVGTARLSICFLALGEPHAIAWRESMSCR